MRAFLKAVSAAGEFVVTDNNKAIILEAKKKLIFPGSLLRCWGPYSNIFSLLKGLYRFVRNPMYIAGLLVLAGEVLLFQSKGVFIYLLVMFGVFHFFVLGREESRLEKRFGEPYKRYRKSVRRWIPRLAPYREYDSES